MGEVAARRGPGPALIYYGLIVTAVVLIGSTTVLSWRALDDLEQAMQGVVHTHDVIAAASGIEATLGKAESAQRDYLLLGDERLLQTFEEVVLDLHRQLDELERLVDDSAAQTERARQLRSDIEDRLSVSRQAISMRQTQGIAEAIAYVRQGRGMTASALAREEARQFQREELRLLRSRQRMLDSYQGQTRTTIAFAIGFGLLAGTLGFGMMSRTQRMRLSQHRAELDAARARQASREKSAFLANMSHEIRTPMNAIFGFSQLLAERVRGEEERRYLRAIKASGKTLLALINDILDLSKIEAGKLDLRAVPTDPHEVIEGSLGMFAQMAADKRLSLRADVDPEVPEAILIDPTRLRQVLFNLIGNAVKYTERGGVVVRLAAEKADAEVEAVRLRLAVEDTGIGIRGEDLERIFDPFVRAEERRAGGSEASGTGLGLSITRRIVELMGGSISVQSMPSQGSTFTVELPHVPLSPEKPAATAAAEHTDMNRLRPARIMVVDDVALNRELIQAIFSDSHHEVITARDGVEAVSLARQHVPDVVLMDIRMPVMDGREAGAAIRSESTLSRVRLVALTASSMVGDERSLREDFDGYVRKPFAREDLYRELARFIPEVDTRDEVDTHEEVAPEQIARGAEREAVIGELRRLRQDVWPELSDSLAMREVRVFATDLVGLGQRAGAAALVAYGRRLAKSVDAFDVLNVESQLAQFPQQLREAGLPAQAEAQGR
ncbi:MAG TPA: ATP-binding protein [Xanthomonadaceae bacterium]|nr:ATP-binding protein [Xanthomonadaceae bacterium]